MFTGSWIRRLFARTPRTLRKAGSRAARGGRVRPAVEGLEDRLAPATFTVNTLGDENDGFGVGNVSLREAIAQANGQAGDDTIDFSVTGTINLNGFLPLLSSNIDIQGPGAASLTVRRVSGGGAYTVFRVNSGATVGLSGLTITNGENADGGGIFNAGTLTVTGCTLSGNSASRNGGGIYNDAFHDTGRLTVTGSTLSGNSAEFGGGICSFGTVTVTNSTLSGNSASRDGGGIYNFDQTVTVVNSTLTGNVADADGNGFSSGGGGIWTFNDDFTFTTLHNTIVAGNLFGTGSTANDIGGKNVESVSRRNLIGTGGSGGLTAGTNGNQVGVAVATVLDPVLNNNGGPTLTHALLADCPAIDAGSNAQVPADTLDLDGDGDTTEPVPFDQRGPGFDRFRGTVDIGAFEVQVDVEEPEASDLAIAGGNNQSTVINSAFAQKLSVLVTDQNGDPLADVVVQFRVLGTGPGGRFPGDLRVVEATTDSNSIARTPALRANNQAGSFQVKATVPGPEAVLFRLTNTRTALPSPRVARFVVNQGNPQRSEINSLTLIFDQQVAIMPEVFRLTRVVIDSGRIVRRLEVYPVALSDVRVVSGRTHAMLRLPTSLADGTYQLFVNRGQVRNAEGDILSGPNTFRFHRLFGDLDGDGRR